MASNVNKGVKTGDADKRGDTKIPQMLPDGRPFPDEPFEGKGGKDQNGGHPPEKGQTDRRDIIT